MNPITPEHVAHLFRPLLAELLAVLRDLSPQDWLRPTVAGSWRVRDVAAHLLDGDLRKLAVYRDDHMPSADPVRDDRDLARLIHGLNATGVAFAARLSPRLITDLLELTGGWVADVLTALDPDGPSRFAVSWAGESESANWMDTGREYTERWHHQAQIRDAAGRPRLLEPAWLMPLLDFSVRVLPRAYAGVAAPAGTSVTLRVEGETSAAWTVVAGAPGWQVFRGEPPAPSAVARLTADDAWRLFYNALPEAARGGRIAIDGPRDLVAPLFGARSIVM